MSKIKFRFSGIFLTVFLGASFPSMAATFRVSDVDLHAHLFMQSLFWDGLGPGVLGSFFEGVRAQDYRDRLLNRVDIASLRESGMRAVVVSYYVHPIFRGAPRDQLRRQIQLTQRLVREAPEWVIVKSPEEADRVLGSGRKILILSLEGASGVLENETDIDEFIDRAGIRIVTPMHFTNDDFGGAALIPGFFGKILNPIAMVFSQLHNEIRTNSTGLKAKGRWLIESLTRRGVWIDLSHASQKAVVDIGEVQASFGHKQVPLYTHATPFWSYGGERSPSADELARVKKQGGALGVFVSQDMFGREETFSSQMIGFLNRVGSDSVAFGSDVGAPISGFREEDEITWAHYGHFKHLRSRLSEKNKGPALNAEAFVKVWKKIKSN